MHGFGQNYVVCCGFHIFMLFSLEEVTVGIAKVGEREGCGDIRVAEGNHRRSRGERRRENTWYTIDPIH